MRKKNKINLLTRSDQDISAKKETHHAKKTFRHIGLYIFSSLIIGGLLISSQKPALADRKSKPFASSIDQTISNETLGTRLLKLIGKDNKTSDSGAVYRFGMGDHLKISFYGRDELSGTRTVDGLGRIYLPIIGIINAKDKDSYQLQEELSKKYSKLSGQPSYVTVEVVQRRPFYVAGLVNKPGAHPFVPGIRVLQAVSLSGGLYRQPLNSPTFIQSQREKMIYLEAKITLQGALARHARIVADIENKKMAKAPRALIKMVGTRRAQGLMAVENEILKLQKNRYNLEYVSVQKSMHNAKTKITAITKRFAGLKKLKALQKSRMTGIQVLNRKKIISKTKIIEAKSDIVRTASLMQEAIAKLADARQELGESRKEFSMLEVNRKLLANTELLKQEQIIKQSKSRLIGSNALIDQIASSSEGDDSEFGQARLVYEILRNEKILRVSETSRLRPDDVLRVRLDHDNGEPGSQPLISFNQNRH